MGVHWRNGEHSSLWPGIHKAFYLMSKPVIVIHGGAPPEIGIYR